MAELVSMKLSSTARKEMTEPSALKGDAPRYPWGLSITLDDDTLEKLKITALPKVGNKRMLTARVEVTSVSSNQSADGDKHQSVALQITEMCLEADTEKAGAEKALYGRGQA